MLSVFFSCNAKFAEAEFTNMPCYLVATDASSSAPSSARVPGPTMDEDHLNDFSAFATNKATYLCTHQRNTCR